MIRNQYNQAPRLTQDTTWESNKNTTKHHTQESKEVSHFQAGDHRQQRTDKKTTNTKHN